MFLEKLEIQGFKSFANKNTLIFPGMVSKEKRGITSVVGPNGSGKSNIADAIRWVLGEQSMKTLRGKKSEDIIFSGSEKTGRLGMAEVSLYLNNEDKKAPLDYSQIILTRRLYRDSTSEYLLNNSRVRLADIEMLLAKSSFGQKTYSVIGQGMVEGFLNTSLAERKEFFDEATGVKQFQIKRDDSLNKLVASYENLTQVEMLLFEIEPRLKSLTRQVNKLKKRELIENELQEAHLVYYGHIWQGLSLKFNEANSKFLEIEKIKMDKEKKLANLNKKLGEMERQNEITEEFNNWQKELAELQEKKNNLNKIIAKLEAEKEIKLEASGQFDLSWLNMKKGEIKKDIEKTNAEISLAEENLGAANEKIKNFEQEKENLNKKIKNLNQEISAIRASSKNNNASKIYSHLNGLFVKLEKCEEENDLIKIKTVIREIKEDLKIIINSPDLEPKKENLEKIIFELEAATIQREEISQKINEAVFKNATQGEKLKYYQERKEKLNNELNQIESKLIKYGSSAGGGSKKEEEKTQREFLEAESKIGEVKEKISNFSKSLEAKRSALFDLQKNIQILQQETNELNASLNELKVNSARFETRLEDLEAEARGALGSLKEIREKKIEGKINLEELKAKIDSLKRSLDLIGGIDPEIEKEYLETKERFDFLYSQVNDLKNAIASLEKIIKELDMVIKERFDKEFKLIQEKFQEYFRILFNGGSAKIIKVLVSEEEEKDKENLKGKDQDESGIIEPETSEDRRKKFEKEQAGNIKKIKYLQKYNATGLAGIEIQATPPGKKIKSISMLSGGERAMTAIALICAIISANPSPFVVLDEVDAALDEANSERLAKILDDLSYRTQFIVITHNRASMRRANILYGVTMQEDGTSKLLSVKLDEIKAR